MGRESGDSKDRCPLLGEASRLYPAADNRSLLGEMSRRGERCRARGERSRRGERYRRAEGEEDGEFGDGHPERSSPGEDKREEGEERSGKSSSIDEEGGTSNLVPCAFFRPRWKSLGCSFSVGSVGGACAVMWMLGTVVKKPNRGGLRSGVE